MVVLTMVKDMNLSVLRWYGVDSMLKSHNASSPPPSRRPLGCALIAHGQIARIRPKRADFHGTIPIANFAVKNAMFNLNENNRIVMAQHPSDMRMGVNCLCGQVRMAGLDPSNGDVYIFVGRSRKVMKILHWEYGGYVVYYKRLEEGRFHPRIFLRQGVGFRSMKWSELVLLMEGISPKVARRHRYEKR